VFARGFEWLKGSGCQTDGIAFLPLPGDPQPDPELSAEGSLPLRISGVVFDYLIRGGVPNFVNLSSFSPRGAVNRCERRAPQDLPWRVCIIQRHRAGERCEAWLTLVTSRRLRPVGVLFYRAQWGVGDLAFVDALIHAIEGRGCNVMPVFSFTLRDDVTAGGRWLPRSFGVICWMPTAACDRCADHHAQLLWARCA